MLENVRGLLDSVFDEYRESILNQIRDLGYKVQIKLLNANDYGVPQLRPRVIIVGIRNEEQGEFHCPEEHPELSKTVGDTLLDLMKANGWKDATKWAKFEQINMESLSATFPKMQNIRPGKWHIVKLGNRNAIKTSSFVQYEHLDYLTRLLAYNRQLAASMGNDYMVAPDVVVYRETAPDEELNDPVVIVDDTVALKADIRQKNGELPILHASISAKWTMRSDRAQNSRTEALNLIRNRKGHLPHIVVVTGEPIYDVCGQSYMRC